MPTLDDLLAGAPAPHPVTASEVAAAVDETRWVVLDDDPTGTQSVTELPVLTAWGGDDLSWALSTGASAVYVMTNSRSLDPETAEARNREVVLNAVAAARAAGVRLEFVSRSDSTLRGHFPLEPDTVIATLRAAAPVAPLPDAVFVIPAFGDSGRVTVGGVHYAGDPESGYLPVGETEFARDATFGYSSSAMPDWIEEKTDGAIAAADVLHLDLATLRAGVDATVEALAGATGGRYVTADIVVEEDMRVLALAIHALRRAGSTFLYRVGPPFVRALIGQEVSTPLERPDLERIVAEGPAAQANAGLIVIGSHVALTTRQLEQLRARSEPVEIELNVPTLLGEGRTAHLDDAVTAAAAQLAIGHVVVRTSRSLVKGADRTDSLRIARAVSDAVVEVVNRLVHEVPLRFVVAKGGITSSDVASRGLEIGRAMVRGSMLPGIVSLWDPIDGPAAHVPYIVFAGNVGTESSLADVVEKLS